MVVSYGWYIEMLLAIVLLGLIVSDGTVELKAKRFLYNYCLGV
jgi:hypothetical protein